MATQDPPRNDPPDKPTGQSRPQVLKSEDLLVGEKEVLIEHRGEFYRLRETRNGKLLLGK